MHVPAERDPHTRTWMILSPRQEVWGKDQRSVRADLARLANAIAHYESVTALIHPDDRAWVEDHTLENVSLVEVEYDDIWIRDTGPVFTLDPEHGLLGLDFNFNGWGRKQTHTHDAALARHLCTLADLPHRRAPVTLEGGALEVDGEGTAILTESCVINPHRNPGLAKADAERLLAPLLGLDRILWLPGVKGTDITDGHTDFYARFTAPRTVVVHLESDPYFKDEHALTREHLRLLERATDAQGRRLNVVPLEGPRHIRKKNASETFAASYANFYVANTAVFLPNFGDDRADQRAYDTLQNLFPDRTILPLPIDHLADGGGGIHCVTLHQPSTTLP